MSPFRIRTEVAEEPPLTGERYRSMIGKLSGLARSARRRRLVHELDRAARASFQGEIGQAVFAVDRRGRIRSREDLRSALQIDTTEPIRTLEDLARQTHPVAADARKIKFLLAASPSSPENDDLIELADGRLLCWRSRPLPRGRGRAWSISDRTQLARSELLQGALFRISEVTREELDLPHLLQRIHRIVAELMDATNFYVALASDRDDTLEFPYFIDEMDPQPQGRSPARGLTGWVLRKGKPILVGPEDFERMVAAGEIEDIGSPSVDWLGVPLTGSSRTFGVMGVQSYREEVRFDTRDLELLTFVAHHIASVVERIRREDELRASERRYRQLFDNNQAIKLVIDPETGDLLDVNSAACAFYGYTQDELMSMKIWQINILTEEEVREEMASALRSRRGYFNFRHRLASGEIRDVEVHSGPLDLGDRTALYSIVHDVTERRRAEKALRRSEEHFRSLIENTSDVMAIVDVQGTIHYNSPSVSRVLGYRAQKTIGSNIFDFAHPDDAASVRSLLEDAVSGDRPHAIEMRIRHREGQWKVLEALAHRLDAESERVVVNCRDISERKLAEQMLQTHAAAMEASTDGIAIIDSRGRFTYVNQAFMQMFGYRRREDLVGHGWRSVLSHGWASEIRGSVLDEFFRTGEYRGELDIRPATRGDFPAEASLYQIGNGSSVCVLRDITERNIAAEQIRYLAYHDSLTGLANRMNFQDRLLLEISRAEREKHKVGLIYLDLDRFKSINDSRGHHFGDQLLQEIGSRLRDSVDPEHLVSRLGGDEFTVLLPHVKEREEVVTAAERVLSAVRDPLVILGDEITCTTSVGIALYPDDGTDADTLKRSADKAMYQAKEQGRDRYQIYNPSLSAASLERISMENALRRAREREELSLHFQPIVSLKTGRLHGFEALLRWNSPEMGSVSPSHFVPVAEAMGIMPSIGEWVIHEACVQAAQWHAHGFRSIAVAVNLSMTQIRTFGLTERISASLDASSLDARFLELEITESGAMENPESIVGELRNIRDLGVRMSLDDFGIGHSSLSHLKRLPIQTLKIDQSFIRDLGHDAETGTIVRAMMDMAHTLRLTVIAEGVETIEQREFLREHGCDYMQGFLFSRPLPAADVLPFIENHRATPS